MAFFDSARKAASRVFTLGQKGTPQAMAALEYGPPNRDQWYRLINSAGAIIGHAYVCRCSTEYHLTGGIFDHKVTRTCGCGQKFCLQDRVERNAQVAREVVAFEAAGLSPRPSLVEIEMARQLGKVIKVKTGPFADNELRDAYNNLPYRPLAGLSRGPRLRDVNDGGFNGEYKYGGSASSNEDPFAGGVGFANPGVFRR